MVNMNKHKDPSVYGLTGPDGRVFYIGRTKTNAQNRLWEHNYRANTGHQAPVYKKMREIGVDKVSYIVLQSIKTEDDAKQIEASWIKELIDSGYSIVNSLGRNGVADSWDEDLKSRAGVSKRGKPTWIKGKTGEEAGWTEERKAAQSIRSKIINSKKPVV